MKDMLQLILGRAGFGKTEAIRRLIKQTGPTAKAQILVVPEQFSFESEKALMAVDGKCRDFEVLSFSRLCDRLFKLYGGICSKRIDDAGRAVFMASAVSQLSDELKVYKRICKKPDFIRGMVGTVKEFKNCSVSAEMLKKAEASLPDGSLKNRLSEITLLYEGYSALLSAEYSDPLDDVTKACELMDEHGFFDDKTIFFDAFKGFTGRQFEIIERAIGSARDVYISLPCDDMENTDPDIFYSVRETARTLKRICLSQNAEFKEPIVLTEDCRHLPILKKMEREIFSGQGSGADNSKASTDSQSGDLNGAQTDLQNQGQSIDPIDNRPDRQSNKQTAIQQISIWDNVQADGQIGESNSPDSEDDLDTEKSRVTEGGFDGEITVFEADTKYDEVDFAASQISKLVREEGYRFREISVIARKAEDYAPLIEQLFTRRGIPYFLDARRPVSGQPLMIAACTAFDVIRSSFSTEKLLTLLKSGIISIDDTDLFELENYCFIWKIDRNDWKNDFVKNPRGMEEKFSEEDKAALERLNNLRKNITAPLLKFEKSLKAAENLKQCAAALFDFLCDINAAESLKSIAQSFSQSGDEQTADLVERSWDMLIMALDRIAVLSSEQSGDADDFYNLFLNLVSLMDMGSAPKGIDQVCIGSAPRTRPAEPRAVFVLGADDGVFPASSVSGGLLSDADRIKLCRCNLPISDHSTKSLCEEGFLFYSAVCASSERLYISYFLSGDGFPSSQVTQIESLSGVKKLSKETLKTSIDCEHTAFEKLTANYHCPTDETNALNAFFKQSGSKKFETLKNFRKIDDTNLSPATAKALFSDNIRVSPTSVESFHRCGFMYLCRAGFKAKYLKPVEIDNQIRGTLVHFVFEKMFLKHGSKELSLLSDEQLRTEIHELVFGFAKERMGQDDISGSFEYQLLNTEELLFLIIKHMAEEMADGKFVTARCELPIGRNEQGSIPAFSVAFDQGLISVTGVVDRVDVYEHDQKTYFRVVDYKTGTKTFSPDELPYGLGLQMLIYLFAIEKYLKQLGKNPVPSGVLYMPARDVSADAASGEDEQSIHKKLRMKGIVLNDIDIIDAMDPAHAGKYIPVNFTNSGNIHGNSLPNIAYPQFFETAEHHIESILEKMGRKIMDGCFPASPLDSGGQSGCKYCDYTSVCPNSGTVVHRTVKKLSKDQQLEILKGGSFDEQ